MIYLIKQFILDFWRGNNLGGLRSKDWPQVRKSFLKENPTCAVCGKKEKFLKPLEVHHCLPFHKNPELELDEKNLITLCREDHLIFGHLKNFRSWNRDILIDSDLWRIKIKNRP